MEVLDKEILKIKSEIQELEDQISQKKFYLSGIERAAGLIKKGRPANQNKEFKEGSTSRKIVEILRKEKKPMHIDEIISSLGVDGLTKLSLVGTISSYARKNEVFKRCGPNTFGLIELEYDILS